ncbi:hypothetical protein [Polaromonas sp.]|uniref:hypothetical protein n=1 Tax=Polaromonas sp. TaxID=1869339 RepID=UPI0018022C5C|nr:hypothetical protein [Polaromonas sp.]NML86634.1 hypothetical protein [Polaromonas sp.]
MRVVKNVASLALAVLLTAACAMSAVQPGMSREDVVAHYGKPSRVLPVAGGTRLQYSSQPAGQRAVMVDLDAAGRVIAVRQMMTLAELSKIEPGKWTRGDVEREFGRPASIDRVASWSGDIMTYRWLDVTQDMYFWVYLDGGNVVQRTGQGMEIPIRMNDNN